MVIRVLILLMVVVTLSGCYQAENYMIRPDPVMGINVYTLDGNRIPGSWVYIIDDSVTLASRQIKASSEACSLYVYSIDAGTPLSLSIDNAMVQIFENSSPRRALPTSKTAAEEGLAGAVIIKLDEFYPKFHCSLGEFEGFCSANTDLSLTVTLLSYPEGKRKYAHASSQRSADGSSGSLCAGASHVMAESVRKATKDVLEKIGEKASSISMSSQ